MIKPISLNLEYYRLYFRFTFATTDACLILRGNASIKVFDILIFLSVCLAVLLKTSVDFKIAIASPFPQLLPVIRKTLELDDTERLSRLLGALVLATTRDQFTLNLLCQKDSEELLCQIGFSSDRGVCRELAISCGLYLQIFAVLKERLLKNSLNTNEIREILQLISSWVSSEDIFISDKCSIELEVLYNFFSFHKYSS